MAKTEITDYSPVAASNTDVNNVGLDTIDSAGNMLPAFHELMAALARTVAGTAPWFDTFAVMNADDNSKQSNISTTNIPSGTTRALDAEALYRNGAPVMTTYTSSGTHTFADKTRFFQIDAVGGGGGGGGMDGQGSGTRGAASGGGSGYCGKTLVRPRGSIETGTVTIGNGGSGGTGSGGGNGSNGQNTAWVDGTNSFTWGGGKGGIGVVGDGSTHAIAEPPGPATTAGGTIYGTSDRNTRGLIIGASTISSALASASGGVGGSSTYGIGGAPGIDSVGGNASGYGSGGAGAAGSETTTNYAGGNGTNGLLIVWEW